MIRLFDDYRVPGAVRWTFILMALIMVSYWVTRAPLTFLIDGVPVRIDVIDYGGVLPSEWLSPTHPPQTMAELSRPPILLSVFWGLFLHASLMHAAMNCLFLYLFGVNIEARLGGLRFLVFYFACGAAGTLMHVATHLDSPLKLIGASGAIAGLMGGYWVWYGNHFFRLQLGTHKTQRRELIIPVKAILVTWLFVQVAFALVPDPRGLDNVAYMTHLGGFACGYVFASQPFKPKRKPRFRVFSGGQEYTD